MKSFLLIFCVAIASIVEAQEYVVRVEQTFQTTNHCNDGHPYIDKMLVSFDGHTEYGIIKSLLTVAIKQHIGHTKSHEINTQIK